MSGKILITGCAKTGTTLVRRLFNAFHLKVFNQSEISLDKLIKSDCDVGKRRSSTIFSNLLEEKELRRQIALIQKHNIRIVNIVRDKASTLKSTNGYVTEERYDECMRQARELSQHIDYTIAYSDLISNPDHVQGAVSKALNLRIVHKWSDFPDWFDGSEEPVGGNLDVDIYRLRRIGEEA